MSLRDEVTPEIKPGDDFYRYVNQKWIDAHPIPDDKPVIAAFNVLSDENKERLKTLLEAPSSDSDSVNVQKIKQFYRSGMDEAGIEQAGLKGVAKILDRAKNLADFESICAYLSDRHAAGAGTLWLLDLDLDDKNSSRYILRIHQSGLGLPERDYYLDDNQRFVLIRQKYLEFLKQLFVLLNHEDAAGAAAAVFEIEKKLAEASMPADERRDAEKTYNLLRVAQLKEEAGFDWDAYFKTLGAEAKEVVVSQPHFLKAATRLLKSQPVEAWRDYFVFHAIRPLMNKLPKAFEELHFDFYGRVISGSKELEPRYRRVISLCEEILPEPAGELFVSAHFDENAKQAINDLVGHLQTAFGRRIQKLDWMSEATKAKAQEKLAAFAANLGYPDKWRDYSSLDTSGSYAANFLAILKLDRQRDMDRLTKPVDRQEWLMSAAAVNAYYWANTNSITFPAGILQPPFFDAAGDFAANYGGIGVVIGHELTHGFDDQGSKFDKIGNMESWWSDADRKKFEELANRLVEQFNSYSIDDHSVNGQLTLGENIADLGGLMIAYDAMQAKLNEVGRDEIDGFTPEQRFFMGYARVWRENIRPELMLRILVSDPHSPNELRVNGGIVNCDYYFEAFDVRPEDKLYKAAEDRVRIW